MIGDIFQPTHLLFILVIALVVLGPKRLPEVSRSLGRGIRDFRVALTGDDRESRESLHRVEYPQPVAPQAPAEYAQPVAPQAPAEYAPQAPLANMRPPAPQPPAASAPQAHAPSDAPEWLHAAAPDAPPETAANAPWDATATGAAVPGQAPVERDS